MASVFGGVRGGLVDLPIPLRYLCECNKTSYFATPNPLWPATRPQKESLENPPDLKAFIILKGYTEVSAGEGGRCATGTAAALLPHASRILRCASLTAAAREQDTSRLLRCASLTVAARKPKALRLRGQDLEASTKCRGPHGKCKCQVIFAPV